MASSSGRSWRRHDAGRLSEGGHGHGARKLAIEQRLQYRREQPERAAERELALRDDARTRRGWLEAQERSEIECLGLAAPAARAVRSIVVRR